MHFQNPPDKLDYYGFVIVQSAGWRVFIFHDCPLHIDRINRELRSAAVACIDVPYLSQRLKGAVCGLKLKNVISVNSISDSMDVKNLHAMRHE